MPGAGIAVTAEWALWGEEEQYSRYRVLSCSDGVLSRDVFRAVLTRYSPGTIASVPQVTVSWLEDREGSYYVGMAIHDHPDAARSGADDREIIQTSYFGVPFGTLAGSTVSYAALYDQFRAIRLPSPDGHPIATTLAASSQGQPDAPSDRLAMRAAALLLTNKPVCILRAQHVSLQERLHFIDAVAALLPYGMRSQLSASTWASSTYREHKLRLFFATAARDADHTINWGASGDRAAIDDRPASLYEEWLREGLLQCVVQLAADTRLSGFGPADVSALLQRIGIGQDRPAKPQRSARRTTRPPFDPTSSVRAAKAAGGSVEELLAACAERLREKTPGSLQPEIDGLRRHLTGQLAEPERARYREMISGSGLLNDHAIAASQRANLYEVLLRLAFGTPITYAVYCEIEMAQLGVRGGTKPLHHNLAEVIVERFTPQDDYVALLVMNSFGKQALAGALDTLSTGDLIAMAAGMAYEPQWRAGHAWVICSIVVRYLTGQKPPVTAASMDLLRTELKKHGYLAPALQQVSPDQDQYQLNLLEALLKAAYGRKLEQRDIREILVADSFAPTPALLAAVLRTANSRHVRLAIWLYAGGMLKEARFSSQTSDSLVALLNTNNALGADAHLELPDRAGRGSDRRMRIISDDSQAPASPVTNNGRSRLSTRK